jgi:hypothetical protein
MYLDKGGEDHEINVRFLHNTETLVAI